MERCLGYILLRLGMGRILLVEWEADGAGLGRRAPLLSAGDGLWHSCHCSKGICRALRAPHVGARDIVGELLKTRRLRPTLWLRLSVVSTKARSRNTNTYGAKSTFFFLKKKRES